MNLTDNQRSAEQETSWDEFLAANSELILTVAKVIAHDHDSAMDCYAYVLERLHENDRERLKAYAVDPRSSFRTWLAVVARRLCVDRYRQKYGRSREIDAESKAQYRVRRRLADLVSVDSALERVAASSDSAAELEQTELLNTVESVLAALAPKDRLLISLRFDNGLSAREIAEIVSLPSPFHVYRRLNSLLAACRDELERRGFRAADG